MAVVAVRSDCVKELSGVFLLFYAFAVVLITVMSPPTPVVESEPSPVPVVASADAKVPISFKLLTGECVTLNIPEDMPFLEVRRLLEVGAALCLRVGGIAAATCFPLPYTRDLDLMCDGVGGCNAGVRLYVCFAWPWCSQLCTVLPRAPASSAAAAA